NPAACALAIKNLEILEKERLVERSAQLGEKLCSEFSEFESHPHVGDIRGKGLLLGIELVEDKTTKEPAHPDKLAKVMAFCKGKGMVIGKNGDTVAGYNNVLTLSPPLSLTDDDFAYMVKTLKEAMTQI
ncbi:MAG TPA: aminotransferase class III-fold pyridoxal phosphate-dependent enzyme, partial [Bacillales bacterium]|nr:aminotransferase class III-fold pyridoxal phosphate-dependent enzyme [Bacillales bacterium]